MDKPRFVKNLTLEAVCPECGKTFERRTAEWGYVFKDKKFCTYKCMRAAERKNEKGAKKK